MALAFAQRTQEAWRAQMGSKHARPLTAVEPEVTFQSGRHCSPVAVATSLISQHSAPDAGPNWPTSGDQTDWGCGGRRDVEIGVQGLRAHRSGCRARVLTPVCPAATLLPLQTLPHSRA